jgi:predicted metal-binding transcription factor (methanogenesis marker protein 9)
MKLNFFLQKPCKIKEMVIKRIEIKSDRWKYWLGMKLKTILNLINNSK